MANTKISALTSATTPLVGTEVLPIVQSGATVKVANNDLRPKQIQSNATSGVMQVVGPAAASTRVMTVPDANFTAARTDAGQTFTGTQAFGSTTASGTTTAGTTTSQKTTTISYEQRFYRTAGDGVANTVIGEISAQVRNYGGADAYSFANVSWATDPTTWYLGELRFATNGSDGTGTTPTTRMTITSGGNVLIGSTTSDSRLRVNGANSTDVLFRAVTFGGTSAFYACASNASLSSGESGTASVWYVRKDGATSRSINAAGTINASGADYAEYMTKAGDFTIAKGDVVGINAQGKLTNVFADAVSFVVKSTDPSYVGGDTWGNAEIIGLEAPKEPYANRTPEKDALETDEEFAVRQAAQANYIAEKAAYDAALEAARQKVDRIAFAGQVPVNVLGATAGQYIVPVNDNGTIKGSAVSNPTFEQYQSAVGKVIAIEADGRARIIVKVV